LAKLERPGEAILRRRPRLGETGLELHLRAEADEVLEHHPVDLFAGVGLRVLRIETVGISAGRERQRSAPYRRLGDRGLRDQDRSRSRSREGDDEPENEQALHEMLLSSRWLPGDRTHRYVRACFHRRSTVRSALPPHAVLLRIAAT